MCGFVGIIHYNQTSENEHSFLEWALNDLRRRGPDQQSIWQDESGHIQFGFARLAIRDLTDAGKQPMVSTDGKLVMMYNGETYNTDHLLRWAEIQISSLKGHADSEVIIECMARRGIMETIRQMDGIFAMVVLNLETRQLYLIRDHAGVKPLYAGFDDKGIVFSSHYQHITSHPYFRDQSINAEALANYFRYGFIQAGEGLFENTYFLPHSHAVVVDLATKSWKYESYKPYTRFQEEALDEVYKYIVSSQLVSDVPVGTFLSGGVDSPLTTAIASKAIPGIRAYTIGVRDKRLDEAPEAARFAACFKVEHTIDYVGEQDVLDAIQQYEESLAEPLGDFSSLITLKVCQAAKKDLTVVLSGDGGDELFYGYPRFRQAARYYPYLAQPLMRRLWMILSSRLKGGTIPFRLLKFSGFLDYYLSAQGQTGNREWLKKLIVRPGKPKMPFFARKYNKPQNLEEALEMSRQIECDIHLQRVLLKVDRASMFHSLEVRTPMLSTEMCKKAFQLDYSLCVQGKHSKKPLRDILEEYSPNMTNGPKKGFEPPMAAWLRSELKQRVQERLASVPSQLKPYMFKEGIDRLWNDHQQKKADYSWPIWTIYSLYTWMEKNKNLFNK